jgi:16S rRNA G1207 methylase RsmC
MTEHYYSEKQTSEFKISKIKAVLRGEEFEFETAPGVFSKTGIDKGSWLMIERAIINSGKVLDLGCGYGPVGIAIAKTCPDCKVTLTDTNERAIKLSKRNAKRNQVKIQAKKGNMYEPVEGQKFDHILLNPPQTAGKKLCNQMIEEAPEHLNKGGSFWLVARHQVGGKGFEKKMEETFGNVETIKRKSGFRLYLSVKQA